MNEAQAIEALDFAIAIAHEAGELALTHFRQTLAVEDKRSRGRFDPVTIADRDMESLLRQRIIARYPDHGIVGEEHADRPGASSFSWIIDPIDGTRAFISGVPAWGTLLGLRENGRCIAGLMHQPYLEETFCASFGNGWLERRGERRILRSRRDARLADAILYCTHPDLFSDGESLQAFERVAAACRLMRYGGDCYSYCLLALGQIDLVIEDTLQPFDIQPLIPIIEAAGGVISCRTGSDAHEGGFIIAAANPELHRQALEILNA